jgi:hypothetical protein
VIVRFVDIGGIVDHHYLNFLRTITSHLKKVLTVMVNYSTNINKANNHLSPKESLNSDGQQFHQYQQSEQSPLTIGGIVDHHC